MAAEDPGVERTKARLATEQKVAEAGLYVACAVAASGPRDQRHRAAEAVAAGVTRDILAVNDGASIVRILMSLGSVDIGQVSQCESWELVLINKLLDYSGAPGFPRSGGRPHHHAPGPVLQVPGLWKAQ